MGIDSDIVPYVAHKVFEATDLYDLGTFHTMVKLCEPDDFTDGTIPLVVNGWTYLYGEDGFHMIGKRNRIYANKWKKNDKIVYTVNESQSSSVGYYELAVIADDETAIVDFCRDQGLYGLTPNSTLSIDHNDIVQQTI